MSVSVSLIRELEEIDPKIKEVLYLILEEIERQREQWEQSVTKREFDELKEVVKNLTKSVAELTEAHKASEKRLTRLENSINELAEAQKRSEQRIDNLEKAIIELTEAQKKTEQRLNRLEITVNELAEAQKKTEQRINELAEAQKKTEQRINELAEAQKKTEQRLNELAEAQKKTEQEIEKLTKRMGEFEDRLEGISHSVGYSLENKSYVALPKILSEKYGLHIEGALVRKYFLLDKKYIQLNIYGHGKKNGEDYVIIGECKVRPSRKEITRFEKYAKKIAEKEGKKPFLLFVAHDFHPKIEEILKEKSIPYIWSYELEKT